MTYGGPPFARASFLRNQIEEVKAELEEARVAGMHGRAQDLLENIQEMQHALFLTGVRLEEDE